MINIQNYSVFFNGHQLLKDISLQIPEGTFFTIIGESGGGKTLLTQGILGLIPSNLKEVGKIEKENRQIEIVVQNPLDSLQKNIRVHTQFQHLLKSKGIKAEVTRKQLIVDALSWVGFTDIDFILKKRIYELSGGMCQKIALAMAFVTNPEVLLVDEPTSALDEESRKTILSLLWKLYEEKKITIIFITHDLSIVTKYSTHVGIIQEGSLIEFGQTQKILSHPKQVYTKELIQLFDA